MLAVHGGVSFKVPENTAKWCADALDSTTENIVTAVSHLEDHKWFNCGRGSNLTAQQTVECEAGFMTSKYFRFGGVGCVSRLKNPIQVAQALAMDPGISGLIRPQILVGKGAEEWAFERGFTLCDPEDLITKAAQKEWAETNGALQAVDNQEDLVQAMEKLDTVGGVAILNHHVEACVSSGGIRFKRPGRLGHCTQMGSGVWADKTRDSLIAISASGCGEALVWTDFCRSLAKAVVNRSPDVLPAQVVEEWFRKNFVNSTYLFDFPAQFRLAGGIVMLQESGCSELLVFHNTPYFPIAFRSRQNRVKAFVSAMKPGQPMKVDSFLL